MIYQNESPPFRLEKDDQYSEIFQVKGYEKDMAVLWSLQWAMTVMKWEYQKSGITKMLMVLLILIRQMVFNEGLVCMI